MRGDEMEKVREKGWYQRVRMGDLVLQCIYEGRQPDPIELLAALCDEPMPERREPVSWLDEASFRRVRGVE